MIVDPWKFKVGPWGVSRAGVMEIRGFRRWKLGFWRRLPGDPRALQDGLEDAVIMAPSAKPTMHWMRGPFARAACGYPGEAMTTLEYDVMADAGEYTPWVACVACLVVAEPMVLAHRLGTR